MHPHGRPCFHLAALFVLGWLTLTARGEGPGPLLVSEVLSWNENGHRDHTGRTPDWIELIINSMACYLNAEFKDTRARALLEEMRAAIEPVMPEQLSRWRTSGSSMSVWNREAHDRRATGECRHCHRASPASRPGNRRD